eukprot:755441-Hanusia_phi.AAC.1
MPLSPSPPLHPPRIRGKDWTYTENQNTREYLEGVRNTVLKNLRCLQGAPSVQMQQLPPALYVDMDSEDEDELTDDQKRVRDLERAIGGRGGKWEDGGGEDGWRCALVRRGWRNGGGESRRQGRAGDEKEQENEMEEEEEEGNLQWQHSAYEGSGFGG